MAHAPFTDAAKSAEADDEDSNQSQLAIQKTRAEHRLKTTRVGRPFQKDAEDLFATFIAAIDLRPHRANFRTYQNSFSTEEAVQTLASLKFSQSSRVLDPDNPAHFMTTTTNFVFSMDATAAISLCQHFMDARYLQNAVDPSLSLFKPRGLHVLTPKGLNILERFLSKTGMDADHLQRLLETEVVCSKLFHVQRSPLEDDILFARMNLHALFRWFIGRRPNYLPKPATNVDASLQYSQRSQGIPLTDITYRNIIGKGAQYKYCFDAVSALEWLCDFTSVVGRDEAAQVGAHFNRLGFIELVGGPERSHKNKNAIIFSVQGTALDSDQPVSHGEFHCVSRTFYKVTPKGCCVAGWTDGSADCLSEKTAEDDIEEQNTLEARRLATAAERLLYILRDQAYRSLFHEFLQESLCEEHILFWMDVEVINRKFYVTSSAIGGANIVQSDRQVTGAQMRADRREHHQALLRKAVAIYKTYLEPSGQYELNTDYSLRTEVVKFLETIPAGKQGKELDRASRIMLCNAEQLQTLIQHYQRIQAHTFRVMMVDSLPKFLEWDKYIVLRDASNDMEVALSQADTPDAVGAYISYSSLIS